MKRYGSKKVQPVVVEVVLPHDLHQAAAFYSRKYRTSLSGIIGLCVAHYFGDTRDHLQCEYCSLARESGCVMPEVGETVPLLDKGTVVVGQPSTEQGF